MRTSAVLAHTTKLKSRHHIFRPFDINKCSISLHIIIKTKSFTIIPLTLALSSRMHMPDHRSSSKRHSHPHKPNTRLCNICPNYDTWDNPGHATTIATPETSEMENWVRVQDLGEGSYGVVWLEKKGQEAVRAVKKVSKANIILNQRELYALKELKEVNIDCYIIPVDVKKLYANAYTI